MRQSPTRYFLKPANLPFNSGYCSGFPERSFSILWKILVRFSLLILARSLDTDFLKVILYIQKLLHFIQGDDVVGRVAETIQGDAKVGLLLQVGLESFLDVIGSRSLRRLGDLVELVDEWIGYSN